MKKYLYVAVLDKIILNQSGIFCIVGELYCNKKNHVKRISQIFIQIEYRNYLRNNNSSKLQNVFFSYKKCISEKHKQGHFVADEYQFVLLFPVDMYKVYRKLFITEQNDRRIVCFTNHQCLNKLIPFLKRKNLEFCAVLLEKRCEAFFV